MGEKHIKNSGTKCNTLDSSPVHLRTSAGPRSTFWALCDPRNSRVHRHTWCAPGTWGPFSHFGHTQSTKHTVTCTVTLNITAFCELHSLICSTRRHGFHNTSQPITNTVNGEAHRLVANNLTGWKVKWLALLVVCIAIILGAFTKLRKATISFVMSVRPSVSLSAWNDSPPTGQILMKFNNWVFFEKLSRKFKFH